MDRAAIALPCPALPCPALPCPALPCLASTRKAANNGMVILRSFDPPARCMLTITMKSQMHAAMCTCADICTYICTDTAWLPSLARHAMPLTPTVSDLQALSANASIASPVQAHGGTAAVATPRTAFDTSDNVMESVRGRQGEEGSPTPEAGNACSERTMQGICCQRLHRCSKPVLARVHLLHNV